MLEYIKKIFGTQQGRILKKYEKVVHEVNRIEKTLQPLSDEELKLKTQEFRDRLKAGETVNDILPEAYAVVKNACRRLCGVEIHVSGYQQKWDMVPYDVQILGAIAMHYGAIAEMQTGEGKTLTASMPLYLNALTGKSSHLITVNDYLAERDCQWVGTIYRYLGLTVNALTNQTPASARKAVYQSDIVYGTASEFGFDYLRDNSMVQSKDDQCQKDHYFAMIDEVDSILIDEARTPLIISGPSANSRQMYDELKDDVAKLVRLQRDLCNKLATEAKKQIDLLRQPDEVEPKKLSKEDDALEKEAYRKLWLVSKGTPQNKILKRVKEDPSQRAQIESWDTYYYSDPNKQERQETLSQLYIIVEERASEFELTDKGIQTWIQEGTNTGNDDFVMLDLGHEYSLIDAAELSDQDNMQKKVQLREEDAKRKERAHNLRQLLRAHLLMEKDVDYIIAEGKIVIIDENTGRPQPGRRFSDGLHQSIEAKEGVAIQSETQTYATITLQNYFRMYEKLSGMTGTAMTEANEFKEIYKLEVLAIPTHRSCKRVDFDDEIYMTEREKYNAIVKEIVDIHKLGRPILIGTESVDISEKLSRILRNNKLEHTVLNAKNHATEAEVIAEAGKKGSITLATNMAGRGTDIKLASGVADVGGLHVIGTTRHQSRRIDRQLRGRSARLGDPGSSKFFVSFEDSLMRLFTSPKITQFLQRFRPPEGEPIKAKVLNKSIETAQKRVEQRNYTIRKHTLEYDDVMNKQRGEIYAFRNDILHTTDPLALANQVLESVCLQMAQKHFTNKSQEGAGNAEEYRNWLMTHFPVTFDHGAFDNDYIELADIEKVSVEKVLEAFTKKIEYQCTFIVEIQKSFNDQAPDIDPTNILSQIVRTILIRNVDHLWQEHLLHIDHLRSEVHLRSIGQKDPLLEFKHEAFLLFDELSVNIKLEIAHALFKFEMMRPQRPEAPKPEAPKSIERAPYRTSLARMAELAELEEDNPAKV